MTFLCLRARSTCIRTFTAYNKISEVVVMVTLLWFSFLVIIVDGQSNDTTSTTAYSTLTPSFPLASDETFPWEDLAKLVSSPDDVLSGPIDLNQWIQQCVDPFKILGADSNSDYNGFESVAVVSNYNLLNESSGLCLDFVSCVFLNCIWPTPQGLASYPLFPKDTSPYALSAELVGTDLGLTTDMDALEPLLGWPTRVVHPRVVADVVHSIHFAQENKVGITVKVAGHSYFGSSSGKNTLLIKMSTYYPKYDDLGSMMECAGAELLEANSANQMSCALAQARGKNAILRVGGGSMFDHAYRAVSVTWNNNPANTNNKYHLVGGGAGTVGAAGGWMASGGLSGTTGMRMYGVGIDQVLHLEMVLPSGTHVRFGPSAWEQVPGMMYPKTTAVTGFCNYQWESPEQEWEWSECTGTDAEIDFNELWFAVRGGGGGTWGIVTSLYYQVHDYPGELAYVSVDVGQFRGNSELYNSEDKMYTVTLLYIRFVLGFLYQPATLGVSEDESTKCTSAKTFTMDPFQGGLMFCYGTAGDTFVANWKKYITLEEQVSALNAVSMPQSIIDNLSNLFVVYAREPSYAEALISSSMHDTTWNFPGRVPDSPRAGVAPVLENFPNMVDSTNTHFPLDILEEHFDGLTELIAKDTRWTPLSQAIYTMGGAIPYTDDGMNALSPTRRYAAFQKAVRNETTRSQYYKLFYGNSDMSGPFPGQACHNHAHVYEMGPVKDDWTKTCPLGLPQAERQELCISQGENFWGTENLARLEAFKQVLDPNGIFICAASIGYKYPIMGEGYDADEWEDWQSGGIDVSVMLSVLLFAVVPLMMHALV